MESFSASASAGVMSEPGGTSVASAFGFSLDAASAAWNSALRTRVGRVRAAAEDVRLPVVELELGRGAHLLDRALRVLHVGRPTEIWSRPERWISGSDTPSESVRLRIVLIASSTACGVTVGTCGVGRPW